jgi:hypothetical protein
LFGDDGSEESALETPPSSEQPDELRQRSRSRAPELRRADKPARDRGKRVRDHRGAQPCTCDAIRTTEELHVKRQLAGLVKRGLGDAANDRNRPIEKIVLRSAGLTRQPTDGQIDEIVATAASVLSPLLGIAMSGNVHAIRKVAELVSNLCAETTTLACMHQEAADVVARERSTWPLNISHDPRERRRTLRLVTGPRRLPLGNPPSQPAAVRKVRGYSSPANAAVLVALKAIEIERSFRIPSELFPSLQPNWSAAAANLPDLEPSTTDAWFKVIWMYVCDRHTGAPEKSDLRRLVATPESAIARDTDSHTRTALRLILKRAFLRLARGRSRDRRRS